MKKRAISLTNSEISAVFFAIGTMVFGFAFKSLISLYNKIFPINPGLGLDIMIIMFCLVFAVMFFAIAIVWINYLVSKNNLNLLIDKITNPDYIGWIRFTRSKGLRLHIVEKKALGYTEGTANRVKAGIINNGDYTVTTANGNQAIIKLDMLNHNVNLEQCAGWQLQSRHYGVIGFKAWERAVNKGKTLFGRKKGVNNE
jgi:hypothetical protein